MAFCLFPAFDRSFTAAAEPPPPTATPRHDKRLIVELSGTECVENLLDIAAGMRPYLHARRCEHHLQRPGNGSADEHPDAEFRDLPSPRRQGSVFQNNLRTMKPAIAININDQQSTGHVEDG
jgi:hypothetical protein